MQVGDIRRRVQDQTFGTSNLTKNVGHDLRGKSAYDNVVMPVDTDDSRHNEATRKQDQISSKESCEHF